MTGATVFLRWVQKRGEESESGTKGTATATAWTLCHNALTAL